MRVIALYKGLVVDNPMVIAVADHPRAPHNRSAVVIAIMNWIY